MSTFQVNQTVARQQQVTALAALQGAQYLYRAQNSTAELNKEQRSVQDNIPNQRKQHINAIQMFKDVDHAALREAAKKQAAIQLQYLKKKEIVDARDTHTEGERIIQMQQLILASSQEQTQIHIIKTRASKEYDLVCAERLYQLKSITTATHLSAVA